MQDSRQATRSASPLVGPPPPLGNLPPVPPEFNADAILAMDAPKLIQVLKDPAATMFQKGRACLRLAVFGPKEAVPALAPLLTDEKLATYARFPLEIIPDPSADDALRDALKKVKGRLLVGVINSIGVRKDGKAVEPLAKLLFDKDSDVARAAASALGYIGDPQAAKILQDGLARTKGPVRAAVAEAGLSCAGRLLARGDRKQALAYYELLKRADMPQPVRLAAMTCILAAETSVIRPKSGEATLPPKG